MSRLLFDVFLIESGMMFLVTKSRPPTRSGPLLGKRHRPPGLCARWRSASIPPGVAEIAKIPTAVGQSTTEAGIGDLFSIELFDRCDPWSIAANSANCDSSRRCSKGCYRACVPSGTKKGCASKFHWLLHKSNCYFP